MLPPANWVIAAVILYVVSELPFIGANRKHFSFRRKAVIQSVYASLKYWYQETSHKKFSEGKQVHVGMEASKTNQHTPQNSLHALSLFHMH